METIQSMTIRALAALLDPIDVDPVKINKVILMKFTNILKKKRAHTHTLMRYDQKKILTCGI